MKRDTPRWLFPGPLKQGSRERLLIFRASTACLLVLVWACSMAQEASSAVTLTVGSFIQVRFMGHGEGNAHWTVVAHSNDFSAMNKFKADGNLPFVVTGTLDVMRGSGTWTFDMDPLVPGDQSSVSSPTGMFNSYASVRYVQPAGKVDAKARLTLSISPQ